MKHLIQEAVEIQDKCYGAEIERRVRMQGSQQQGEQSLCNGAVGVRIEMHNM